MRLVVPTPSRMVSWVSEILIGLVLGLTISISSISIITLIFAGDLQTFLAQGISIALVSTSVGLLIVTLFSSSPQIVGYLQSNPIVVIAATISALMSGMVSEAALLPTILMVIALSSLVTGLLMVLLAYTGWARIIQYIPYPVIGAFLGGVGLLILRGAFSTMTGLPPALENVSTYLEPAQILRWAPGLIFGISLFVLMKRIKHILTLPLTLLVGLLLFLGVVAVAGIPFDEVVARGLMLGALETRGGWHWQAINLQATDWQFIGTNIISLGSVFLLAIVTLLLNISSMELVLKEDLDFNHALRIAGFTNLVSGLLGGAIAFQSMTFTSLNVKLGGRRRVTGIVACIVCLLVLFVGETVLQYMPVALLGGILVFLGLNFVYDWLIRSYTQFSRLEYGLLLLIVAVIVTSGIIVGIAVGSVAAVALFGYNASRIDILQNRYSGRQLQSKVERAVHYQNRLRTLGDEIFVLELRGYIFFGTALRLQDEIRERFQNETQRPPRYIIIDFRRVLSIDSSALLTFAKISSLVQRQDSTLCFTGLSPHLATYLQRHGPFKTMICDQFPDIDLALEHYEDQLLKIHNVTTQHLPVSLIAQLSDMGVSKAVRKQLPTYLQKLTVEEGEYLIQQGDAADAMYFIELGRVSIYLEREDGSRLRLQSSEFGTMVGEVGFFTGAPRSASVVADRTTFAYRLTHEAYDRMKEEHPALALELSEAIVRVLGSRLARTDSALADLNVS